MARKFIIGQEVEIVRNLGIRGGYGKNEYYYAGDLEDVPLHSKGRIEDIYQDEICIRIKDEEEWDFHPDELMPSFYNLNNVRRKIRKLEKHPLFEIAEHAPLFVYQGKVYSLGEGNPDCFFINGDGKKGVVEVSRLESLDALALQRNERNIQEIRESYTNKVLEYLGLRGINKGNVPEFIYSKVFPHFRDTGKQEEKIAKLLGAKTKSAKPTNKKVDNGHLEQAIDAVLEEINRAEEEIKEAYSKWGFIILNRNENCKRIFWNRDCALLDGKLYYMKHSKSKNPKLMLRLNNDSLLLRAAGSIKDAERGYQEALSMKIGISALKKLDKERISKIMKKDKTVAVQNLKEHKEKDFGFFVDECEYCDKEGYHVFLEIPSFGIKYREDYYLFRKSKIAIHVRNFDGEFSYDDEVCIFDNYGYLSSLCFSSAKIPTKGKDLGEVIAKRLMFAKNMILQGASNDWYKYEIYKKSSLDKLRKMKVKIRKSVWEL